MQLVLIMGCGRSKAVSDGSFDGDEQDTNDNYSKVKKKEKKTKKSSSKKDSNKTNSANGNPSIPKNGSLYEANETSNDSDKVPTLPPISSPQDSPQKTNSPDESMPTGVPNLALTRSHMTASQADFFKMLDEKIEKGNDYGDT